MKLLYSLILLFIFSCSKGQTFIGAGGAPSVVTPAGNDSIWLIIFNGESNSGGIAPNSSASAPEVALQTKTKILNNINLNFEGLDIGSNNILLHAGLESYDSSSHGWELEASNIVNTDAYFNDLVYLCKTGAGGSRVDQWVSRTKIGDTYYPELDMFYKFSSRVTRSKTILDSMNVAYREAIFISLGINDALASTNVDSFHNRMVNHINYMRLITGPTTPVVMTKFYTTSVTYDDVINMYNTGMDQIATELDHVYAINGTATMSVDGLHWDYAEMKTVAGRLMDILKNNY